MFLSRKTTPETSIPGAFSAYQTAGGHDQIEQKGVITLYHIFCLTETQIPEASVDGQLHVLLESLHGLLRLLAVHAVHSQAVSVPVQEGLNQLDLGL